MTYATMLDPDWEAIQPADLRRAEAEALRRQVDYVHAASPFYQRKFAEAGLGPDAIHTPDDLVKLPFTTKAELRGSQEREPPFGDFLACDPVKVARIHRTSGSTGRFIFTALTSADIKWANLVGGRAFWASGLRPHHRIVHCLNYQLWMGGYTEHGNIERTGAAVVPFGVGNTKLLVRVIRDAGVDAIMGTTSYPRVLESVVREELGVEPGDLGLKLAILGGEPGMEDPEFRARIEQVWGMRAQNLFGISDILCTFGAVCDHVYEIHYQGAGAMIPQLVNPETGDPLAIEEGAVGELVGTSINKEAQPLLRYRTRDVLEITGTGPCRCGRTGFRFRMIGRADDMVHVRGINVFPTGIARVLNGLHLAVTGEFQVVLDHPPPYEGLDITIEEGEATTDDERPALTNRIVRALKDELDFTARIDLVPPGTLPRSQVGKAIRVRRTY